MRYRLYADGEKSIHTRKSSPRQRRMPTGQTHAVVYPGPRLQTMCGRSTTGLSEFPDEDFEASPGQMKCQACRVAVAQS